MLGISNQEAIANLSRDLKIFQSDIRTELGQFKVRNDVEIQQKVREEMYDQIKQNNIGITKRIEELKAQLKRQLSKNEEDVRATLMMEKEDFSKRMEGYKHSMKSLLMVAKSNKLDTGANSNMKKSSSRPDLVEKRSPRNGSQSPNPGRTMSRHSS